VKRRRGAFIVSLYELHTSIVRSLPIHGKSLHVQPQDLMEYVSPRLNKRGPAESEEYVPEGDVTTEQRPAESGRNASEVDVANETAYKRKPVEASSSSGVTSMLGGPDRDPPVEQAQQESAEVPKQKPEPSAEAREGNGNGTTVSGSEDVGPRRYLAHETEKQLVILLI
jgi:hypothetical protein